MDIVQIFYIIVAIPMLMMLLFSIYMFYATNHPTKMTLLRVEPTPLILAKNIYNEVLGYKLLRINGLGRSAYPFFIILTICIIAFGIYKEALPTVLIIVFLITAILASTIRFVADIQFFEHGMIYKGAVGDEKTVPYENIYSVTFSFPKSTSYNIYFIEIYYEDIFEDGKIKAVVSLDKIDKIVNILTNNDVNVE